MSDMTQRLYHHHHHHYHLLNTFTQMSNKHLSLNKSYLTKYPIISKPSLSTVLPSIQTKNLDNFLTSYILSVSKFHFHHLQNASRTDYIYNFTATSMLLATVTFPQVAAIDLLQAGFPASVLTTPQVYGKHSPSQIIFSFYKDPLKISLNLFLSHEFKYIKHNPGPSLVVQQLRICLPMQGTQV